MHIYIKGYKAFASNILKNIINLPSIGTDNKQQKQLTNKAINFSIQVKSFGIL